MSRFLASFIALAFCASLGSVALASSTSHPVAKAHMMKRMSCPKNKVYVHGYMKNGKWVKGYCRSK